MTTYKDGGTYYYEFHCGTTRFSRWHLDDRKAQKLLARYLRLVYAKKEPNLIFAGTAGFARTFTKIDGFIPCSGRVVKENFELSPEAIAEFLRIAR